MNFYNNFLKYCTMAKKSPSKVIVEIGGTKSAITRWKNGSKPTDATIQKVADYFGVTLEEMKGDPEIKKTPTPEGERNNEKEEIFKRFEAADEATRAVVLRLLGLQ